MAAVFRNCFSADNASFSHPSFVKTHLALSVAHTCVSISRCPKAALPMLR